MTAEEYLEKHKDEYIKAVLDYTKKATKTEWTALRALQKSGILDKWGNLSKRYRD